MNAIPTDPATKPDPNPAASEATAAEADSAPSSADEAPFLPGKYPAQAFVLRGPARRVIRFRRNIIIAASTFVIAVVIGVTAMALRPMLSKSAAPAANLDVGDASRPPDALSGLPTTYGDVPRLGPPLPGDLGRPILEHERALESTPPAAAPSPAADHGAELAQERAASELKSARESGVLVQIAGAGSTTSDPSPPPAPASAAPAKPLALDPDKDPGGQQHKADFLKTPDDGGDVNPHALTKAFSPYTLNAGSVIAASLITGLNSDLPGLVTAQVTENAYDSVTGRILLIPQGSRLLGSYDSVVAFGQSRALVVWQRILFPDGSSVQIDNWPATDAAGYSGLSDKIDRHTFQLLKGVALSTLLGVGTQLNLSNESDLVMALRQSTQLSVSRAGDQLVTKNLNIQPTLKVRPGAALCVVLHKDLVLQPWKGAL